MYREMAPNRLLRHAAIAALAAVATVGASAAQPQHTTITGAGATFPYPIYSHWFDEYAKRRPEVEFTYQSIGSGGGIRQLTEAFVFFGASDAPMLEEELLAAPGRIIHIPTVVGAVVPVYNVPGVPRELKFTGALLADMFLGRITNWNDPAIARVNEDIVLPPLEITPVFRADSSGTSYVWSDFLSKVSPEWRRLVGANRLSTVPHGLSVKGGSEGVSGAVTQTRGAIGYVELTYAVRNGLAAGTVQNSEGEFVRASVASIRAAADAAVGRMPRDLRVSITNAPGKGVYPATSFTWLLLYENADRRRSRLMVDFIKWALSDGQAMAPDLGYAPLPPAIVSLAAEALAKIKT
jgi:phosphate transport system substrate-binding protein